MCTRLTPRSLKIKMTVRLFRPVAEEDRLRLVATDAGWRVRGPLQARDFACEGRWTRGGELLPPIRRWDFEAVARFAIERYLAALREALQARSEKAGGAASDDSDPDSETAELRALVADLEREGERSLSGKMHVTGRSPSAAPRAAEVEIEPWEIEP
jgi:hypothetical protein